MAEGDADALCLPFEVGGGGDEEVAAGGGVDFFGEVVPASALAGDGICLAGRLSSVDG